VVADTSQAIQNNRVKIWIDGVAQTNTIATGNAGPALNDTFGGFNTAVLHDIADGGATLNSFDGYMTEVNFVDGQALTSTSFGQTDGNGYWVPKQYTGTYGTNGFYLQFSNTASLSTLSQDSSGNSNNWTANNISLTSGVTYDSMIDVPGNSYAVLNPLTKGSGTTLSEANLLINTNSAEFYGANATFGISSGKFYWEIVSGSSVGLSLIGIRNSSASTSIYVGGDSNGYAYYQNNGFKYNGTGTAYGASWTLNDVIGVAFDADAGTLTFYKNNVSQGIAYAGIPAGTWFPAFSDGTSGNGTADYVNFGQRPFAYTPPSGYLALNENNIPEVSGDLETPGFVWIKNRSAIQNHALFDQVRGATKYLSSNATTAETTDVNSLIEFNKNGFYIGSSSAVNTLNNNYVAWAWKAGSTGVTNTSGSITSTVSANTTNGFSVVTYTGTGTTGSVGHGLGVAPKMIIGKARTLAGGDSGNWTVWHTSLSSSTMVISMNGTSTPSDSAVNGAKPLPTSSVIYVNNSSGVNSSGSTLVQYCFAEIDGFSKFGSYVGNASTNGAFVYCGFKPAFVMTKCISTTGDWRIYDNLRPGYNVQGGTLLANSTAAETTSAEIDLLSNGFKLRTTTDPNAAQTYIFAAFAETPFKYATAR
jgi:hypothetical protein